MQRNGSFWKIAVMVVVTLVIGGSAGFATTDAIRTWYVTLEKPFFNPPDWIFGPVWTLLFVLMGYAAGMVWTSEASAFMKRRALAVYAIQLALNFSWSILFFALKKPLFALVDIVLLLVAILWCMQLFRPIEARAAHLLVPYLLWVGFATILNAAIVSMN